MAFSGQGGSVDHVAFAVRSMRAALDVYDVLFDYQLIYGTDEDRLQIRTMQLLVDGKSKIELMEPLSDESPLAAHIESRGEGFHHMTVKVADMFQVIDDLGAIGVDTIGTSTAEPGWLETYTHPRTCHGTMLQIAQTDHDWFAPFPGLTVDDVLEGRLVWTGTAVVWRDPARIVEQWPPRI
ncbi:MAG: hypothetical protein GY720_19710 [bacterium]|nr:hypothetical protein [bacterium]